MKEQGKRMNNKGFSLVELIIVIAIMAILAGALAPQLIKYLDKSRKSTDVQTAQTIATAVNAALAEEEAYNAAASTKVSDCNSTGNSFQKAIGEIVGSSIPKPKYLPSTYSDFYILVDSTDKSFKIYAGDAAPSVADELKIVLYPTVGTNYK